MGFVATLTAVACIIAADTGAYFVGKNLGRTKLTDISPKKTVEGALGGMASAVVVALLFWSVFAWPGSAISAAGYGVSIILSLGLHAACFLVIRRLFPWMDHTKAVQCDYQLHAVPWCCNRTQLAMPA